jgi:hypothetical protein
MKFSSVSGVIIALVMLKLELFLNMNWFIYLVITQFAWGLFYAAISILSFRPVAGHSGRAVWGVGLGRLVARIVGSNPAQGMDVCPLSFCVVLFCVGRGLATG